MAQGLEFYQAALMQADFLAWEVDLAAGRALSVPTGGSEKCAKTYEVPPEETDVLGYLLKNCRQGDALSFEALLAALRRGECVEQDVVYVPHEAVKTIFRIEAKPLGRMGAAEAGDADRAGAQTDAAGEPGDPDDSGEPGASGRAIVILRDVSAQQFQTGEYADQFRYFHTLATRNALFCIRADLTDRVLLEDLIHPDNPQTYEEIMQNGFGMDALGSDNRPLREHVARDVLLAHQAAGHWKLSGIFHFAEAQENNILWIKVFVRVLRSPKNDHIEMFMYSYDDSEGELVKRMMKRMSEVVYDYTGTLNPAAHTIRFSNHPELPANEDLPYDEAAAGLANAVSEERESVLRSISPETITENLRLNETYSLILEHNDHTRKLLQYCWLDERRDLVFVVATDVTKQYRRDQENLRRVEEALLAAEQANEAKTEFLSRISHDIRTPIGAVLNLTDFARADIDDKEKLKQDIDKIATSGRFLLSLINDVLDVAKIDSGKIELKPEPYAFDEYISEIRNIIEPMCKENGITCTVEAPGSEACADKQYAMVDRVRLNQITLNLLTNAVRYNKEHGSVLFHADISVINNHRYMFWFKVQDTGIGMSDSFQKVMFEEFSQETDNPYRTKLRTGTGLGLPIVKKLIDLMGGTIEVDSTLGEGTCITVRMPLEVAESPEAFDPEAAAAAAAATMPALTGHVLLAEDNEINAEIAKRIFDEMGITVDHAENGKKAVERFAAAAPGTYRAVFMDIQMPVMNGYEATRAIRALDRADAAEIPVIAMTADAFTDAMEKADAAGMSAFITKPMSSAKIRETLERFA